VLSHILHIFSEAADKCGGVKKWSLLTSGVLEVSSNCAKFRNDPRKRGIEAVLVEKVHHHEIGWLFYIKK
jgi:hypothetical protein